MNPSSHLELGHLFSVLGQAKCSQVLVIGNLREEAREVTEASRIVHVFRELSGVALCMRFLSQALGSARPGSDPSSAIFQLCDFGLWCLFRPQFPCL